MNKTELAILLARERVKAQAELLGACTPNTPELGAILKGANLYDHALQESLKKVATAKQLKPSNDNHCWYCQEQALYPNPFDPDGHPYRLCMSCGATSMLSELHPYHKTLYQPYKRLAGEVARLLGDARRAKLPLGVHQLRIPARCN